MKHIVYLLWIFLWRVICLILSIGSFIMVFGVFFTDGRELAGKSFLWLCLSITSFILADNLILSPEKAKEINAYIKELEEKSKEE